jgi:hypothetical protein
MCDCYTAKCNGFGCKNYVEVHIADFCIDREHLLVYCHECVAKAIGSNSAYETEAIAVISVLQDLVENASQIFIDKIEAEYQVTNTDGKEIGVPGRFVVFAATVPVAHGITLN